MARINVLADTELSEPTLIEGLPGVGLVGKIAVDHVIEEFDMTHYANVHCEGIPRVVVYQEGESKLAPPVRLYADADHDLLALQSDVPISPQAAREFAECIAGWYDDKSITPLFLSGLPAEKDENPPALTGVASGDVEGHLRDAGIDVPNETGLVSGPTGALLAHAVETDRDAMGLIVESDPQFPDPEAARIIITEGIQPLTGIDVPVDDLVEHAEEIRQAKQNLAERMRDADEESSQARPLRMYQ